MISLSYHDTGEIRYTHKNNIRVNFVEIIHVDLNQLKISYDCRTMWQLS